MRETTFYGQPILVLREATEPHEDNKHVCPVSAGEPTTRDEYHKMIFQCVCGKRYRCRRSVIDDDMYVWVRRWWPFPPRNKNWPNKTNYDLEAKGQWR